VQSNSIKRDAYFQVAKAFGVSGELVEDVLAAFPQSTRAEVFDRVVRRLRQEDSPPRWGGEASPKLADEMTNAYGAICEREITVCPEVPGASEALEILNNAGLDLFINSATPLSALGNLVRLRGFDRYVKDMFGTPAGKYENLSTISSRHGAKPKETLVVGDGDDDWAAARRFGAWFVGVTATENRFGEQPEQVVHDLRELPTLLAEFQQND